MRLTVVYKISDILNLPKSKLLSFWLKVTYLISAVTQQGAPFYPFTNQYPRHVFLEKTQARSGQNWNMNPSVVPASIKGAIMFIKEKPD